MKIYNKSAFAFGVVCAFALPLFALGVVSADWWQWILTIAVSCRYLYIGLSKAANKQADAIGRHYKETAVRLYGKYSYIKVNLPLILVGAFLVLPFLFDTSLIL